MSRFATTGEIIGTIADEAKPNSYEIGPDNTVSFDPEKLFDLMEDEEQNDWRVPSIKLCQ